LKNPCISNPIEVAEYSVANKLVEQAALWVPSALKKRNRIIATIQAKMKKRDNKFGLEVPRAVKCALEIDQETGTDLWKKAIKKEMHHVSCAFNILEEGAPEPRISKCIPCLMTLESVFCFGWSCN
jgi:hypothetical protein